MQGWIDATVNLDALEKRKGLVPGRVLSYATFNTVTILSEIFRPSLFLEFSHNSHHQVNRHLHRHFTVYSHNNITLQVCMLAYNPVCVACFVRIKMSKYTNIQLICQILKRRQILNWELKFYTPNHRFFSWHTTFHHNRTHQLLTLDKLA